jgi:hypothetical protein
MSEAPKQQEVIVRDADGAHVRKSNQEIGYRVKSGHLSLLSRKFLNVLIWYAQEMRDKEDESGRWNLPVAQLLKDAKFASRDYYLMRDALDELQEVRVIRPAKGGGVTSEVMIPSYTLDNVAHEGNEELARGQKKRGGELRLWFMLPPELKKQLLDPEQYTRLPIAIMATMKTVPGLALYEICRRYATNPGGVTNRDTWQNWWRVLTGATPDTEPPEFKYANRDAFKRGVEEVNKLTDIKVEVIEFKSGKFVRDLQFTVRMKDQGRLDMGPPPIDAGLLSRITELGFSISDAERMAARYSDADILATLDLVRDRVQHPTLTPIESPAAYFRKALRDKYAASKVIAKKPQKPTVEAVKPPPDSEPQDPAAGLAMAAFESLPVPDQKRRLELFAATLKEPLTSTYAKQGLGSAVIRRSLAGWLARGG